MSNPITPYAGSYGQLQTAVAAAGGTLNVNYPTGTTQATFSDGSYAGTGVVITNGQNQYLESTGAITVAYNATNITITNNSPYPWNVGDTLDYGFGRAGYNYNFTGKQTPRPAAASSTPEIQYIVNALIKAGIFL